MHYGAAQKLTPEAAILQLLERAQTDLSLPEVLDQVDPHGVEEPAIKSAIWQLVDRRVVEMTSERKLRLTPKLNSNDAPA